MTEKGQDYLNHFSKFELRLNYFPELNGVGVGVGVDLHLVHSHGCVVSS